MLIRRRRHEKGAAAIETALSLLVLMFILTAAINFGHAMVVRHRLLNATTQAVRICSLVDQAIAGQCVLQQVNASMGALVAACQPLQVNPQPGNIGGIEVLRTQVNCNYAGGPWSGFLRRRLDTQLTLRAQAMMPTR